ncbi:MAG TPA: chemotaxis protein CheX [Marinospirillum sp.]|uniref:chemotaxis protein CheX n=1 Tax=Marinospirillum sp. TaxID=2183934 RepID=UPI002B466216|nr:chemotaxis protein CheX [Marinospirillum sp.]HKM15733.1 chemotaxis protein CheX [Marinospirillum sp.]
MRADFINPFLHAMINVLRTMCDLHPQVGKPVLKEDNVARGVVTGFIDLMGEHTAGSMAISFSEPVAIDLVTRMLGDHPTKIDDTVCDLVGEITNIVSGGAKTILSESGFNFYLSQPVTFVGEGHKILHSVHGPKILIPFHVESGDFVVEVCFRE